MDDLKAELANFQLLALNRLNALVEEIKSLKNTIAANYSELSSLQRTVKKLSDAQVKDTITSQNIYPFNAPTNVSIPQSLVPIKPLIVEEKKSWWRF